MRGWSEGGGVRVGDLSGGELPPVPSIVGGPAHHDCALRVVVVIFS